MAVAQRKSKRRGAAPATRPAASPRHGRRSRGPLLRRVLRSGWSWLAVGVLAVAGLVTLSAVSGRGGSGAARSDATPDPATVASAGAVALPASDGSTIRLDDLRGHRVILFFYEGASCGTCQTGLAELQGQLSAISAQGGRVLGVTTDPVETSTSLARGLNLGFPIVEDRGHVLGSAYGLYEASGHMGAVDAHGVVVLDSTGRATWVKNASATMYVATEDILAAFRDA